MQFINGWSPLCNNRQAIWFPAAGVHILNQETTEDVFNIASAERGWTWFAHGHEANVSLPFGFRGENVQSLI